MESIKNSVWSSTFNTESNNTALVALQLDCNYISARMHSSPHPKKTWVNLILLVNNMASNYDYDMSPIVNIHINNFFIEKMGSLKPRISINSEPELMSRIYNLCHKSYKHYQPVTYSYGNNSYKFSENVINFITKETGKPIYDFLPLT